MSAPAAGQVEADLLRKFLRFQSVSGSEGEFTRFVADWARAQGFEIDLWQADESHLSRYELSRARHIPLAGRPTLVIRLPGTGGGRSLLFNAHADVVSAGEISAWTHDPWAGELADGKMFGRGACDVKGPLASALAALLLLKADRPPGDIMVEVIPGEEDCVGLGTLTSLARGHRADAVIVLEPTECMPRCASRGGCRFEVEVVGRAVHGTVKWLGEDAIEAMRELLGALRDIERRWNDPAADPLFARYPIARPITIDTVRGGVWQGMVCDRCVCSGYLELLPGDDRELWRARLEREIRQALPNRPGVANAIRITFTEDYPGHFTDPMQKFCSTAQEVVANIADPPWEGWAAFNSGCEAGLRHSLEKTPTLVWGPGSLAQAHAADEFIGLAQLARATRLFHRFALEWCGSND